MNLGKWHRWVRIVEVDDYLRQGWMALPTLQGTSHGQYSVHMIQFCDCGRLPAKDNGPYQQHAGEQGKYPEVA